MITPSTSALLRFHASHRPGAIALIDHGREFTYAQMHRNRVKVTEALRHFGVPPGGLVAVGASDLYVHWLLLLACEYLGLTSTSFLPRTEPLPEALLSRLDLILGDPAETRWRDRNFHEISPGWLDAVLRADLPQGHVEPAEIAIKPDAPIRVIASSGTTGRPKIFFKSRYSYDVKLDQEFLVNEITPASLYLHTLAFTVPASYARATCCLRNGATSIYQGVDGAVDAIIKYKPSHISVFPLTLEKILNDLPDDFEKPPRMLLRVGAAILPPALRNRALERLVSDVSYIYSGGESNMVGVLDSEGVATVIPGVEVDIVDDEDEILPPLQTGRIRIRAPWIAKAYLDDPETSARTFRDGWYYSGDAGQMVSPGRITILGRYDQMLNIGGLKIAPETIEEMLVTTGARGLALTRDNVAVTSVPNSDGVDHICVAVQLPENAAISSIEEHIRRAIPEYLGEVRIKRVEALPQTSSQKIARGRLRGLFL